ncbi:MAG: helix-turn-helix domain-containing protein, partial [Acidobacteriota bacterium]
GRENFERQFILSRLQEAGGNVVRAAELLGLERSNLYRKMRALGIRGGDLNS